MADPQPRPDSVSAEPAEEGSAERLPEAVEEGEPPFFGSWRGMYLLVLGNLAVLVVLFYVLTEMYR